MIKSEKEYTSYIKDCGLPFYQAFFERVSDELGSIQDFYCLAAIDIDHFKLYNDIYGFQKGNELLLAVENALQNSGYLAGYMGGDDFSIFMPDRSDVSEKLQSDLDHVLFEQTGDPGFVTRFGIYTIDNKDTDIAYMYDHAILALQNTRGNYVSRIGRYDGYLKKQLEEEHFLLSNAVQALKQDEFVIYLQPQVALDTGRILGYEALARWMHPVRGIISPGSFVPLFEKNGLITQLDMQIWEKTAGLLHSLLERGLKIVPVSVNVSRVDIYMLDIVRIFMDLTRKYEIPPHYLNIEITESIYAENEEKISQIVRDFQKEGFQVLLDDFGSGYSSLNILNKVNVDVLKIDMRFLDADENGIGKTVGILESVVRMARLLNMRVIAEGIETREQVDYLNRIGCRYGQGYYFSKPLPVESAISRYSQEDYDFSGIQTNLSAELQIEELLHSGLLGDWLLERILGGVAFYAVSKQGHVELLRANASYYRTVRTSASEVPEKHRDIIKWIYEDDRESFRRLFEQAHENPSAGTAGTIRYVREGELIIQLQFRVFFLREDNDYNLFCATVSESETES